MFQMAQNWHFSTVLSGIITRKREQSTGDDGSALALKSMGRVNQSLKQRVSVTLQNGDLSPQK